MSCQDNIVGNLRWTSARAFASGLILAVGLGQWPTAQAAVSQSPLLGRSGSGALPNLMLTLDTSGSMASEYMPDGDTVAVGTRTFNNSIESTWSTSTSMRRLDANATTLTRAVRSPQVNRIYYDPSVKYSPWRKQDASLWDSAKRDAAMRNPADSSEGSFDVTARTTGSTPTSNAVVYLLKTDTSGAYLDPNTAGNYTQIDINAPGNPTFTKYPSRTDCSGASVCTQTEEQQNFANWFQFHRTRLLLTKAAMFETFAGMDKVVRLGWGQIRNGLAAKYCYLNPATGYCGTYFDYFPATPSVDGVSNVKAVEQGVRDLTEDHRKKLFDFIQSLDPSGGTPLRGAMKAVGDYFSRTDASGPWSNTPGGNDASAPLTCRRAYNILTTDGYYNVDRSNDINVGDIDGDGFGNTLADIAGKYYNTDLNKSVANGLQASTKDPATWQHLVQFTVGLGVNGTLDPSGTVPGKTGWPNPNVDLDDNSPTKNDDLWHAAVNSTGYYFSAKDGKTLARALQTGFSEIRSREASEAGIATAARTLVDNNRKYIPTYRSGDWTGEVSAYKLDAAGKATDLVWTASSKLPAAADRNILTWDYTAATGVDFKWDSLNTTLKTRLTNGSESLVNYLRGDTTLEGTTYRDRINVLGDIVGSTPLLLGGAAAQDFGYASLATGGSTYAAHVTNKRKRANLLFVGANDGMLHAFQGTTGVEAFAYVPMAVFGKLDKLTKSDYGTTANPHQFYVNGPQVEADAYLKLGTETSASWHNLVVGTYGAGAPGMYALDVTKSPALTKSSILWELAGNDVGVMMTPPQIGVLPGGKWKAFMGNGYDSASGKAALLVVDLATGGIDKTLTVTSTGSGANGLSGVRLVYNANKEVVAAYAGDLHGNLWRFDFVNATNTATSTSADWVVGFGGNPLFVAKNPDLVRRQPVTAIPVVYPHPQGGNLVVFGTGKLLEASDQSSTDAQSFYGVWDKTLSGTVSASTAPTFTRNDLVRQTVSTTVVATRDQFAFYNVSSNAVNWASKFGWYLDLSDMASTMPGLRDIYSPQALNKEFVMMTAIAPATSSAAACGTADGNSITFVLPALTGAQYADPVFDTSGDGIVNSDSKKGPVDKNTAAFSTGAMGDELFLSSGGGGGDGTGDPTKDAHDGSLQDTKGSLVIDLPSGESTIKSRIWRTLVKPPL